MKNALTHGLKTKRDLDLMIDEKTLELRLKFHNSFLLFARTFYELVEGREFVVPHPKGRESHVITIAKMLTKVKNLETLRGIINLPPGHFKSTLACLFIAWTMGMYPDCRWLYISYSFELATKCTYFIRRIMSSQFYKDVFDVHIANDSKAKDDFQTTQGGRVKAFGSKGSITGFDAGLPGVDRISGGFIYDDAHKMDEVHSDTIRQSVIDNYVNTVQSRVRSAKVPGLFIGQRGHEEDLAAYLINGMDGQNWESVILKSLDENRSPLYPESFPIEMLEAMERTSPYMFASQHQQDPQPAGGAIFKKDWFVLLEENPEMLCSFITVDTAETSKTHNDATVFSFWGYYEIKDLTRSSGMHGLHSIDSRELRIEPHQLENEFMEFYADCMMFPVKPYLCAMEKKSTGVTLVSILKERLRGIVVKPIERTAESGSKTKRFLDCQESVAKRLISFPSYGKHTARCIEHMGKITANNTHAHDDFADTMADAIDMAFLKKTLYYSHKNQSVSIMKEMSDSFEKRQNSLRRAYYGR